MKGILNNSYPAISDVIFFISMVVMIPSVSYGHTLDNTAGTTYFACDCGPGANAACIAGNDDATGTSPATPWKTIEKARLAFAGLSAGDTIALCRGGAFTLIGHDWENPRCTAENPCTVTDYAPDWETSCTDRAIVTCPAAGTAFSFTDSGNADHEEGYVISNLDVRGTDGTGTGFFFFNDIDDVILSNLIISRFDIGVLIQGSNLPNPGSNARNERITLKNSQILDNASQGFEGSCDDCVIQNNIFENNGYRDIAYYHNLYWDGAVESKGGRISGNILSRSSVVGNTCQGVSLIVHGKHQSLMIERNVVYEEVGMASQACWGIAVDTAYESPEGFPGLVIRGNIIKNMGNIGIGVNACTDCLIEGNQILQENSFTTTAIAVPDRNRGTEDTAMNRVTVRNNFIRLSSPTNRTAIVLGGEGAGHTSSGNVIAYSGGSIDWSCFSYPLPVTSYTLIDYNFCRFPFTASGKWEAAAGSLADWQSISGFDLHSVQQ